MSIQRQGTYQFLELYKDMEAFALHLEQVHFTAMRKAQEPYMTGELTRRIGMARQPVFSSYRNWCPGTPKRAGPFRSPGTDPSMF